MALGAIIPPQSNPSVLMHRQNATRQLPSFQRILLCTDFSLVSEAATVVTIDLCRRAGAKLTVLHVCEYGTSPARTEGDAAYLGERLQREERSMEDLVSRVRKDGISVEALTETGHPPVSIVEFIASHQVDLAVVGTNGINGIERMMFGSTAEAVFRHATCPVLIVGPRVSNKQQNAHGPVVFATDFHEPAKHAAMCAASLADAIAAPIDCLHVLPLAVEDEGEDGIAASIMKEALHQLAEQAQISDEKATYSVRYDSEVSHGVVSYAKERKAGFIIMGVRRGQMLSSHLPPHLTYRVISAAPCPVLTVSLEAARRASTSESDPLIDSWKS